MIIYIHSHTDKAMVWLGGNGPPKFLLKKKILFYIWVLILEILFYKITLLPLKKISLILLILLL